MKWLLLIALCVLPAFPALAEDHDKVIHFSYGFVSTAILSAAINERLDDPWFSFFTAFFITQSIGVLKEIAFDGRPDFGDVRANALGGLSAGVLFFVFEF